MNETVILKNLSIGYQSKQHVTVVAEQLNGTIHSGELTCLLGRNGIGKSTLLRTLSAFQPALSGDIMMRNSENSEYSKISEYSDKQLSRLIGVVLTEKPDVRNMTTEELVGMGRSPYTDFWGTLSANDHRIVEEAITLVGIASLKDVTSIRSVTVNARR